MNNTWIPFPTEPGVWASSHYDDKAKRWSVPDYSKIHSVYEDPPSANGEDFGDERSFTIKPDELVRWRKVGEFAPPDEPMPDLRTYEITFRRRIENTAVVEVKAESAGKAEALAWAKVQSGVPWSNNAYGQPFVTDVKEKP